MGHHYGEWCGSARLDRDAAVPDRKPADELGHGRGIGNARQVEGFIATPTGARCDATTRPLSSSNSATASIWLWAPRRFSAVPLNTNTCLPDRVG